MMWWWSERGLSFVRREEGGTAGFGRSRIITDSFECADGEFVMMHSGGEGGFKRSMEILGFGDRVRTIEGRPEMSVPLDDERAGDRQGAGAEGVRGPAPRRVDQAVR